MAGSRAFTATIANSKVMQSAATNAHERTSECNDEEFDAVLSEAEKGPRAASWLPSGAKYASRCNPPGPGGM
jgi:hypothetical protein